MSATIEIDRGAAFNRIVADEVARARSGAYIRRADSDGMPDEIGEHLDLLAKRIALVHGLALALSRAVVIVALIRLDLEARVSA